MSHPFVGAYSPSTISNYVTGIRAWHIIHRVQWDVPDTHLKQLLSGAQRIAPLSLTRPPRLPITIAHMLKIRELCNLSRPLHATFFACLVPMFYTCSRLGKFVLPNLSAFNPEIHVKNWICTLMKSENITRSPFFTFPSPKCQKTVKMFFWQLKTML